MGLKIRSKEYQAENVLEAALARIRQCYEQFDMVYVSFSAGKDSTALLACTIAVARELNRLPVQVVFVDEEAIHPPTVDYANRMRNNPEVKLDWYCLPVKHRNACSKASPHWYPWRESERALWVRELPEWGIREHPAFVPEMSFQEWMPLLYGPQHGKVCCLTGIRTQESLRRYRLIASKRNDAFMQTTAENKNAYRAFPIYDWSSEDVWRLVSQWDLDYNRTYDVFNQTRWHGKLLTQRVCPPYGEEAMRGLWVYAECWPELWHKILYRVPGAATAWRYGATELWSNWTKPDGLTWEQQFHVLLAGYDTEHQDIIKTNVNSLIQRHAVYTADTVQDEIPHPITGASWRFFAKLAAKGDFKGRQKQNMQGDSFKTRNALKITHEEALARYGRPHSRPINSYMADLAAAGADAITLNDPAEDEDATDGSD